jgi:regulator of sirC expression with transglutaminase-like and TPR domain
MNPILPMCCAPEAFNLLARQVHMIESSDALLNGAVAISMHQMPDINPARIDQTLQRYTDRVRARVRGDQPQAMLAHLHQLLFEEEGFTGNLDDYYNTANSYLPAVLKSKQGLPITLSVIYKIIAARLGMNVWGVGLPGHFLVGLESAGTSMLVDPFAGGRIVTEEEASGRVREIFGEEVEWSDELLQPTSHRHWLTRMLQNLLNLFGTAGKYADVAAVLEMEMLLWPEQERLQRDLGLVLARIGLAQPAWAWLDHYLKNNPDDPQRTDLMQLLDVLTA